MRGRGCPQISDIDVNVLCSVVKGFLRSLVDNLIPNSQWKAFVDAAQMDDKFEMKSGLVHQINSLPQPNRDTLAHMMLHLQR